MPLDDYDRSHAYIIKYLVGDNRVIIQVANHNGNQMFLGTLADIEPFCEVLRGSMTKATALESIEKGN